VALYLNDYRDLQTSEASGTFFEAAPLPAHLVQTFRYDNLMHRERHRSEPPAAAPPGIRGNIREPGKRSCS
jgi:hypothetical protein